MPKVIALKNEWSGAVLRCHEENRPSRDLSVLGRHPLDVRRLICMPVGGTYRVGVIKSEIWTVEFRYDLTPQGTVKLRLPTWIEKVGCTCEDCTIVRRNYCAEQTKHGVRTWLHDLRAHNNVAQYLNACASIARKYDALIVYNQKRRHARIVTPTFVVLPEEDEKEAPAEYADRVTH